mgnify:CR=1 FL=1
MEQFAEFVVDQWLLFIFLVIIIVLITRTWVQPMLSGVKELPIQDAIRFMNQNDAVVLDVRIEKEYDEGHIKNAIHIPVGTLEARAQELEKYKSAPILISCQSGNRSRQAYQALNKHGFTQLSCLAGGINAWINANLPITKK